MLQNILAPLDGSTLAECVLPHAIALANAFGSQLTFLRVADETRSSGSSRPIDPLRWQIDKREAGAYLESILSRYMHTGLTIQTILLEGNAAERIIEFGQANNIDLIVLSSHGQSGLSGWNISSVAQKIMLRPFSSTLIVRAYQASLPSTEQQRYNRILLPLDGSLRAECVLPIATTLAQRYNAHILAVHVVTKPEMPRRTHLNDEDLLLSSHIVERNVEEGTHYLQQLRGLVAADIETRLVQSDSVTSALHEIAGREEIDLVILSAHGYTGQTHWPYGSVVTNFVAYGIAPVLIVQDARQETMAPGLEVTTRRPEGRPDAQI
jgi:nucleotide-binding universal stress UspA family protein